tara:strand:+ start:604 stop:942 length:339 start_codon:yes stop_codon:yes gene_type:complete
MISEYKTVNGERIKMSAEEISARQAEVNDFNSKSAERKLSLIKELRLQKLKETDWYSNSDVTMPDNIKTWRQQLRDLPQTYTTEEQYDGLLEMQGDFPNQTYKHTIWKQPTE